MGILKETYSEPVEQSNDEDINAKYKQAILTAIGSETGAWNEYNTILEMEKDVDQELVSHFHDTIVDIRDEEMKHVGQLTTKVSEVPEMQQAYEMGKKEAEEGEEQSMDTEEQTSKETEEKQEEVKESVLTESIVEKVPDNTRLFSSDDILEIILTNFEPTEDTETLIYKLFGTDEELTAEEVDAKLVQVQQVLNILPENMETLEQLIMSSRDPRVERVSDFRNDMDNDIGIIRNAIESVYTEAARVKLEKVIEELSAIEYLGDKDTGWTKQHTIYGNNPKSKVVG